MHYKKLIAAAAAIAQLLVLLPSAGVSAAADDSSAIEQSVSDVIMTEEETAAATDAAAAAETELLTEAVGAATETTELTEAIEPSANAEATEPTEITEESASSESTEAMETTEPTEASAEALSGAETFVSDLYLQILGRNVDASGLAHWASLLESGERTAAEVVYGLAFSTEYQNKQATDAEYITMLYRALLGRQPSTSELSSWCEKAQRFSRKYMLNRFIQTDAFAATCDGYGLVRGEITLTENRDMHVELTNFIAALYEQCYESKPTAGALNTWTGYVLSGDKTLTQVCSEMLDAVSCVSNSRYAAIMYRGILLREPALSGQLHWANVLDKGTSRFSVLLKILKSAEFTTKSESWGFTPYLTDLNSLAATVQVTANSTVYQTASTSGTSHGTVYANQILSVTGITGDWYRVSFHNQVGYIQRSKVNAYEGSSIKVLPVSNIPQSSTIGGTPLPTGCEAASLSVLLQYLGYTDASKNLLADTYMPKGSIGSTDPNYAFIGTPEYSSSYGAYSNVMIQTANNYFAAKGASDHRVVDIGGSDMEALYAQIDAGHPVLVWYTMNCTSTRAYGATWTLQKGTAWTAPGTGSYTFTWKKSEHCSVLVGYNREKGTVILADVWANSGAASGGLTEYSAEKFESAYNWLGKQALILTQVSTPVIGDVNEDGVLSMLDAVLLQKYLLGLTDLTASQSDAGDINADLRLDVYDLALLKKRLFA